MKELSTEKKNLCLELHDCYKEDGKKTIEGVFRSNSWPTREGYGAVYMNACRINHSCNPNVSHDYDV